MVSVTVALTELTIITHALHQDTDKYNDMLNALKQIESMDTYSIIYRDDEQFKNDEEMHTIVIDDRDYIGILEIPKLSIKIPILEELTDSNLQVAPCRFFGNVSQGNMVIGGHNYTTHFGNLKRLQSNDTLCFTDADGNIFKYEVISVDRLAPTEVHEMLSGEWDLTLFTCTLDGEQRVVVRLRLIN